MATSNVADMTTMMRSGRVDSWICRARAKRDVAVEMPFVKFVEDDGADTLQVGISQHPAQQHAFGHVTDARGGRGDVVEPHLIADLAAKLNVASLRDPRREHARGQPARLQDRHLAVAQQTAVKQHLRHLGRFARAGGRGENQPLLRGQSFEQSCSISKIGKSGFRIARSK